MSAPVKDAALNAEAWVSSEVKKAITIAHLAHLPMYAVLVFVLAFTAYFVHRTLADNEAALARADTRYELLTQQETADRKVWQDSLAQRNANTAQVQVIERTITVRDQAAATEVQKVTAPDNTVATVVADSTTHLKAAPIVEVDGLLGFGKADVQQFIGTAITAGQLKQDLADKTAQLDLSSTSLTSAESDLAKCQTDLTASNKAVDDYKKIAKKSKWRKVGDTLEKIGLFAAGAYIGHTI